MGKPAQDAVVQDHGGVQVAALGDISGQGHDQLALVDVHSLVHHIMLSQIQGPDLLQTTLLPAFPEKAAANGIHHPVMVVPAADIDSGSAQEAPVLLPQAFCTHGLHLFEGAVLILAVTPVRTEVLETAMKGKAGLVV